MALTIKALKKLQEKQEQKLDLLLETGFANNIIIADLYDDITNIKIQILQLRNQKIQKIYQKNEKK